MPRPVLRGESVPEKTMLITTAIVTTAAINYRELQSMLVDIVGLVMTR